MLSCYQKLIFITKIYTQESYCMPKTKTPMLYLNLSSLHPQNVINLNPLTLYALTVAEPEKDEHSAFHIS